jgi:hypothetical protein
LQIEARPGQRSTPSAGLVCDDLPADPLRTMAVVTLTGEGQTKIHLAYMPTDLANLIYVTLNTGRVTECPQDTLTPLYYATLQPLLTSMWGL